MAPLPIADERLAGLEAAAARAAGGDYRVVSWVGATPDDRLDAVAALRARMSVDAPADDIDWPEEIWDAARVRVYDERYLSAGSAVFFAVAEHVPSGRLAGYTEIAVHPWSMTAQQGDTLVLAEHRGHRLGMLLKVANLRAAQRAHPELTGVMTGNSTSNSYMLSINDALGFETFVFSGVWQKVL
ncbi:hypothetical protein [Gryllotalpicola protaetiae]|uniref:GNAT family N-acetyltransferase n=1 Tax=Gryllotalpicola protaetiae TaxID=2419771 RepID=A0A387BHL4_9MICO|nr:hypothetical protein [Gryllotalpicola protaetiae]AYG02148.1 hypothetical protein D7I44_00455 [Gryllotalpicola protaetiae]